MRLLLILLPFFVFVTSAFASEKECEGRVSRPTASMLNVLKQGMEAGALGVENAKAFLADPQWSNPFARENASLKNGMFVRAFTLLDAEQTADGRLQLKLEFGKHLAKITGDATAAAQASQDTAAIVAPEKFAETFHLNDTCVSNGISFGRFEGRPVILGGFYPGDNRNGNFKLIMHDPFNPKKGQREREVAFWKTAPRGHEVAVFFSVGEREFAYYRSWDAVIDLRKRERFAMTSAPKYVREAYAAQAPAEKGRDDFPQRAKGNFYSVDFEGKTYSTLTEKTRVRFRLGRTELKPIETGEWGTISTPQVFGYQGRLLGAVLYYSQALEKIIMKVQDLNSGEEVSSVIWRDMYFQPLRVTFIADVPYLHFAQESLAELGILEGQFYLENAITGQIERFLLGGEATDLSFFNWRGSPYAAWAMKDAIVVRDLTTRSDMRVAADLVDVSQANTFEYQGELYMWVHFSSEKPSQIYKLTRPVGRRVPASTPKDCEERLSEPVHGLFAVLKRGLENGVLTIEVARAFAEAKTWENPFLKVSATATAPMFARSFAALDVTLNDGDRANVKRLFHKELVSRGLSDAKAEAAKQETANILAPVKVASVSAGWGRGEDNDRVTAGIFEGRPIFLEGKYTGPDLDKYKLVLLDPFHPDESQRERTLVNWRTTWDKEDNPWFFKYARKEYVAFPNWKIVIDLKAGEVYTFNKAPERLRDKLSARYDAPFAGAKGIGSVSNAAGPDIAALITESKVRFRLGRKELQSMPLAGLGINATSYVSYPLAFANGEDLLGAVSHVNYDTGKIELNVHNLNTGDAVSRAILPDAFFTPMQVTYIKGVPFLHFNVGSGRSVSFPHRQFFVVNALTGDVQAIDLGEQPTNVEVYQWLGRPHLIWATEEKLIVRDMETGEEIALREPLENVSQINVAEYQGTVYALLQFDNERPGELYRLYSTGEGR